MNHKLSMTCCVLVLLCASACSKRLAPRIGLVGEYLFKGNSRDKSSYHNHGQVQRAVLIKGHQGKSASAYEFNGVDQFITIPSSLQNNFKYGQDFSISLWVAIDQNQKDQGSTLNDILRKWRGDTQGYPFAIVYYNHTALDSLQNRFILFGTMDPFAATVLNYSRLLLKAGRTLRIWYLSKKAIG